MAFLQKRLSYQTNFKYSLTGQIKKFLLNHPISNKRKDSQIKIKDSFLKTFYFLHNSAKTNFYPIKKTRRTIKSPLFHKATVPSGFASVLLLSFVTLMMTGIIGFSFLSTGIKNITRVQSYCIKANLKGQKELGILLTRLLNLNDRVLFFHNTRKALEASLATATALGLVNLIPPLEKKLTFVHKTQKSLMAKQKHLLSQSFLTKRKTFNHFKKQLKNFNIFNVREETLYKKALAVKQKREGDKAYTYEPVPDFTNYQKSRFSWKMQPFFPLDKNFPWLSPTNQKTVSSHNCTASLKKKGKKWISTLYH